MTKSETNEFFSAEFNFSFTFLHLWCVVVFMLWSVSFHVRWLNSSHNACAPNHRVTSLWIELMTMTAHHHYHPEKENWNFTNSFMWWPPDGHLYFICTFILYAWCDSQSSLTFHFIFKRPNTAIYFVSFLELNHLSYSFMYSVSMAMKWNYGQWPYTKVLTLTVNSSTDLYSVTSHKHRTRQCDL